MTMVLLHWHPSDLVQMNRRERALTIAFLDKYNSDQKKQESEMKRNSRRKH